MTVLGLSRQVLGLDTCVLDSMTGGAGASLNTLTLDFETVSIRDWRYFVLVQLMTYS